MTYLLLLVFVGICFKNWFFPGFIAAGDLWPAAGEMIHTISLLPASWSDLYGGGLGASTVPYLWNYFQYATPLFVLGRILHLPWECIVRFGYLFPFLAITIYSSYALAKHVIHSSFSWIGALIYTINTYSILIISGGQTGVAMAYGLAPLVMLQFIKRIDDDALTIRQSITNGLWLALLAVCDLRLTYLIVAAVFLYFLVQHAKKSPRHFFHQLAHVFVIPSIVAASMHLYWIIPAVVYGKTVSGLSEVYTNTGMLKFLSVADFSHTISLLHPNWPENLFGKVYFLQPEFLLLPVAAFCAVLCIRKIKHKQTVLYFAALALIGAFLAKGVNEPFGWLFNWCFSHIPGFVMFRDPTKFYLFIALGYAILIPFYLDHIGSLLKKKAWIVTLLFMVFWGITIREVCVGSIHGTLDAVSVPDDYRIFEKQIGSDHAFFRTFWVPTVQRFAFPTVNHPSIDAIALTKESSASGVMKWLETRGAEAQLLRWSAQYVVVPIDSAGEIFTTERRYDDAKRISILNQLDALPWLKRQSQYANLGVWKIKSDSGRFWMADGSYITFIAKNTTNFTLFNITAKAGDTITMSENFSPLWKARFGSVDVASRQTIDGLNEFIVPHDYSGDVTVRYVPQELLVIGLLISGIFFLVYVVLLLTI